MKYSNGLRLRELVLFLIGAATFVHEVIYSLTERPFLIAASLAMMGFPLVLRSDAWVRKNGKNGGNAS